MWSDREIPDREYISAKPYLRFDERLWNDLLRNMAEAGVNMLLIDLGDGVKYESHPEISVKNAWTIQHLKEELQKIRDLGMEPIPKLNFSTTHDTWLGPYSRCVSTDKYYEVCHDLIHEVIDIFDKPRFFHLGMDEETCHHQRYYNYVVVRQYELWWHDLNFLLDEVRKGGARPWIWSDHLWRHPEEFFKNMPKDVIQSNWYYRSEFTEDIDYVKAYIDLDEHGYDQIPTGSNHSIPDNFQKTVAFCKRRLNPEHLLGFLQTVWRPTLETFRERHIQAIEAIREGISVWKEK